MIAECFCDQCTGNLPCEAVGHWYGDDDQRNATCKSCGEVNGPLLAFIGRVAKVQKRSGLSYEDARRLLALREAAKELIAGGLRNRMAWAGITEADL